MTKYCLKKMALFYDYKTIASPVGDLTLVADDTALLSLTFGPNILEQDPKFKYGHKKQNLILMKTEIQLNEYFYGQRTSFNIPLFLNGTDFQKRAWLELLNIPYGQCISYKEQARLIGDPNLARAVGSANGKNPIAILVPCHRVISTSGMLSGFSGGVEIKRKLLALEGINLIK